MKIYYFLNNLGIDNYNFFISKVFLVKKIEDIDVLINKYYIKIGENNNGKIGKADFIEAFMFLKVYLQKGGNIFDIEWVYKKNFLIFNECFYEENNLKWIKVEGNITLVTSRDLFNNSFFNYLKKLSEKNIKYNIYKIHFGKTFYFEDKINFLSKIVKNRKKYVGNLIIPFLMNKELKNIYSLLNFVYLNIGKKFILKNSIGVTGNNVKAINIDNIGKKSKELNYLKEKFFYGGVYNYVSPYFTEFYDIDTEFRIYYTYIEKKVKIYSIKNRVNKVKGNGDIFQKDNFSYSNISTIWKFLDLIDFYNNYSSLYDDILNIVEKQGISSGVLEICKLNNGEIRFIELNSMGGTLMYPGQDEQNLKRYYSDIWKNIIKTDIVRNKFSIIISHLNEGYLLNIMLDNFYNYIKYDNYEIIIVDDGSDDLSHLDFIKSHFLKDKIKLFFVDKLGVSKNRNFGASKATGNFLFFTDSHMFIKDDILEKVNNEIIKNNYLNAFQISVGSLDDKKIEGNSCVLSRNTTDLSSFYRFFKSDYRRGIVEIPSIIGHCFFIKQELFKEIGGFSPLMNSYGDDDTYLSLKLWFRGYSCYKLQDISINHRFRKSFYNYDIDIKDLIQNNLIIILLFFNDKRKKMAFNIYTEKYGEIFNKIYKGLLNNKEIMNYIEEEKENFIINDDEYFNKFDDYFIN